MYVCNIIDNIYLLYVCVSIYTQDQIWGRPGVKVVYSNWNDVYFTIMKELHR